MTTSFTNDQGTGVVAADGFTSTGSSPSSFSGGVTLGGLVYQTAQRIAAAGATQGAATAITASFVFIVTSTASARGIKLPLAVTNLMVQIISFCTQGTKVYPNTNDRIKTTATNTAVVQAGFKGEIYVAKDATTWGTLVGA